MTPFSQSKHAMLNGEKLHLSEDGKKSDVELERTLFQLIGEVDAVTAISEARFDHQFRDNPIEPKAPAWVRSLHGRMVLINDDTVSGYGDGAFFGAAEDISVHISSGPENSAEIAFWAADKHTPKATLYVGIVMAETLFGQTFGAVWLGATNPRVRIVLAAEGFQWGPERAFSEPHEQSNFVIEAGARRAQLRSIALVSGASRSEE